MTILVTAESVVLALLVVLVAGLLRSHADILRALHGLGAGVGDPSDAVGAPGGASGAAGALPSVGAGVPGSAPDLVGSTRDGEAAAVAVAGAGHDTLVAFLSSGCATCAAFWHALRSGAAAELGAGVRVVVVTRDEAEESASALDRLAPAGITVVMSSAAWDDYAVPGSPYFVYVEGATGRPAGAGTAARWDQLLSLCAQARADDARARRRGGRAAPGGAPVHWLDDAGREARADRELMAAGIHPGHPSLHPPVHPDGGAGEASAR